MSFSHENSFSSNRLYHPGPTDDYLSGHPLLRLAYYGSHVSLQMIIDSYNHSRYNETFNIYLDEDDDLALVGIERFVGNIGGDPIRYTSLGEVPQPHRHEIEQRIEMLRRKKK